MTMLVRLKPHDPRRRHVMRQYTHGPSRRKFEEKKGWYKVDDELAEYLATVPQLQNDPDSPLAFDVCTPDQAKHVDARERKAESERRTARDAMADPIDLTSDAVQKRFNQTKVLSEPKKARSAPAPQSALSKAFDVGPGEEEEGNEEDEDEDEEEDELPGTETELPETDSADAAADWDEPPAPASTKPESPSAKRTAKKAAPAKKAASKQAPRTRSMTAG